MSKERLWQTVDDNSEMLRKAARDIWDHPELSLEEEYASKLQAEIMTDVGFKVTHGLSCLSTGMVAEYGSGGPVIGIIGEYDALSGLSQKSQPNREPVTVGAPGHGCGHNLLGVGGMGAAIAVKDAIERGEVSGTVRYYGCPAEEELLGKIYMLRDGYFDDCDVLLYWHPSSNNIPWRSPLLASRSIVYHFKGITAHAPQAHLGRSALDAVELMNVGANYLREHLSRDIYLHYSILGNGIAPNSVPDRCEVWYMMRAPKVSILDPAVQRLNNVARGAALMTGTELTNIEVLGGGNETISNQTLADLLCDNMEEIGGPGFTAEEYEYAKKIYDQFTPEELERGAQAFEVPMEDLHKVLQTDIMRNSTAAFIPASGDFDHSWVKPFGSVFIATWPIGVFTHTWQATACTGSDVGFRGMLFAAKTLAGATYDLMKDQTLLKKVKEEFEHTTKDIEYKFNIAADAIPRRVQ